MRSIGHRIGPRGNSRWLELAGLLGAVLLGAIAVSLLLGTPRADNLFFGADSTVMPLVQRSIEDGEPFQWRMTSTIFAVEIPVFALLSLVVKGVFTRVLVSGIVNYVLLYLMLRWIAGVLGARLSRPVKIGASLIGVAIPALMVALEVTWTVRTIEFASMLLSTSYYYPVLIGMFAAVAMVARMLQVPGRAQAGYAVALGVMTAVLVMSNPLFVGWAVAPILGTLFVILLGRRRGVVWRVLWTTILATGVGMAAALVIRDRLGDVVGKGADQYVGGVSVALEYYSRYTIGESLQTWRGVVEMVLLVVLIAFSVYVAVHGIRRSDSVELLFAALIPPVIVVVIVAGTILTGAGAARYLQPLLFAPLIAVVVWAAQRAQPRAVGGPQVGQAATTDPAETGTGEDIDSRDPAREPAGNPGGRAVRVGAGVAAVALLVGGTVALVDLGRFAASTRYTATDCLVEWIDGRDIAGAGNFWLVRPMLAFGPDGLQLVQMEDAVTPTVWMTNRYDFEQDRKISFVLVEQRSWYPESSTEFSEQKNVYPKTLGAPAEIIGCDDDEYWIYDYAGTPGEEILTERLSAWRD